MSKNRKQSPRKRDAIHPPVRSAVPVADPPDDWHRRHQDGRFGASGPYGGSEDQWANDQGTSGVRAGEVPHAPRPSVRQAAGYRPRFDPEPYRPERMYGHDAGEPVGKGGWEPAGPQSQFGGADDAGAYAPHRGGWSRGQRTLPKGYERSDERIREDVCEHLSRAYRLDVSDVSVAVADGVVTLDGTVPVRGMKHAIEDIADDCVGVKDVENRIKVRRSSGPGTDPAGLARTEDDALLLNARQR
ncbi:BON domain-containing protein [Verticiella sediminum]|nr:BON domain-containing protein [Verticiella sediminum]